MVYGLVRDFLYPGRSIASKEAEFLKEKSMWEILISAYVVL
jgi:hypothetical protein